MAYDEELSARFRDALEGHVWITEKKMMGGMCFMLEGNMIGGADRSGGSGRSGGTGRDADGRGRFMFRVGKDNEAEALSRDGAEMVEMGGRRFGGMVFVAEDAVETDAVLSEWVALALSFTTTLEPKS